MLYVLSGPHTASKNFQHHNMCGSWSTFVRSRQQTAVEHHTGGDWFVKVNPSLAAVMLQEPDMIHITSGLMHPKQCAVCKSLLVTGSDLTM